MKKDFIQDILINLIAKRKKKLEEDKIMKKNEQNLSLTEINAYEQIIKRNKINYYGFPLTWILICSCCLIFLFLAGFVYFYGNGIYHFKEIAEPIFLVFTKVILFGLCLDIFFIVLSVISEGYNERKLKRKLLLNKQ